jgi:hypothetical protein
VLNLGKHPQAVNIHDMPNPQERDFHHGRKSKNFRDETFCKNFAARKQVFYGINQVGKSEYIRETQVVDHWFSWEA